MKGKTLVAVIVTVVSLGGFAANASADAMTDAILAQSVEQDATEPGPIVATADASQRCYRGVVHHRRWVTAGFTIASLTVQQNGWCSNLAQTKITRDFGWSFGTYAWGPYCITNVSRTDSWDVYPTWKHGQEHGSVGVSYPWGCGAVKSGTSSIRIASNGYFDWNY